MTAPEVLAERVQLFMAIERNCACAVDECGLTLIVCNVHVALRDEDFVRHMAFGRSLAEQMLREEFFCEPEVVA